MPTRSLAVLVAFVVIVSGACTGDTGTNNSPKQEPQTIEGPLSSQRWFTTACDLTKPILRRVRRGYVEGRSPDVAFIPETPNYFEGFAHSGPWPYLQRVPFVFYGPGFVAPTGDVRGAREVTMADLAPTIARFLGIEMPSGRPGRAVPEVIAATGQGTTRPKLIVTAVLDGGGWNTLERWAGRWPYLEELMEGGVSVTNATVGSSPSVTPPIHASLGTGTYPNQHGIVDIPLRNGDVVEDSWEDDDPANLQVTTLADEYDLATDNQALIGLIAESRWHLGMIGHGAAQPGGDKDIAVLSDLTTGGGLYTNPDHYELPAYLEDTSAFEALVEDVDRMDGTSDRSWFAQSLENTDLLRFTPVWTLYQQRHIAEVIEQEGFGRDNVTDLLFLNYKFIDHSGHKYALDAEEMGEAVELSDRALRDLVMVLDREVGKNAWILTVTADHGVQPPVEGGWLIHQQPLTDATEQNFGAGPGELVLEDRPLGLWLDHAYSEENGIQFEAVADFLVRYTLGDDLGDGEEVPPGQDESDRLFRAAFPTDRLDEVWTCSLRRDQ